MTNNDPAPTTNPTTTTRESRVLIACALSAVGYALAHLHEASDLAAQLLAQVPATSEDHARARELAERVAEMTQGLDQRVLDQVQDNGE